MFGFGKDSNNLLKKAAEKIIDDFSERQIAEQTRVIESFKNLIAENQEHAKKLETMLSSVPNDKNVRYDNREKIYECMLINQIEELKRNISEERLRISDEREKKEREQSFYIERANEQQEQKQIQFKNSMKKIEHDIKLIVMRLESEKNMLKDDENHLLNVITKISSIKELMEISK